MAFFNVRFFSNELERPVAFEMYIPNDPRTYLHQEPGPYADRPMKVLFNLHGYTGSGSIGGITNLCDHYNFAVVAPNGDNAFWLDGQSRAHNYGRLVGIELVDYIRKTFGLAMRPEDTYVMGLSMGGFGSIRTALRYPDRFGKLGAMSSALLVNGLIGMKKENEKRPGDFAYYTECFGDLDKLAESESNPEYLVKRILAEGGKMPQMYICCGTEDFLIENNREFHAFLDKQGVEHIYRESAGGHDVVYWGENSEKIIKWMFA